MNTKLIGEAKAILADESLSQCELAQRELENQLEQIGTNVSAIVVRLSSILLPEPNEGKSTGDNVLPVEASLNTRVLRLRAEDARNINSALRLLLARIDL